MNFDKSIPLRLLILWGLFGSEVERELLIEDRIGLMKQNKMKNKNVLNHLLQDDWTSGF
jgi:hypothetical protein